MQLLISFVSFEFMKTIKPLILLNFLLILTNSIWGQTNLFPNELKGFELYQKGKLEKINLLVSNEKDIKKVFGKSCDSGCDYDEDWTVSFSFLSKDDHISEMDDRGNDRKFFPPRKYVGKLSIIRFRPKKHISIDNLSFSKVFNRIFGYESGNLTRKDAVSAITFSDRNGLKYNIYQREMPGEKYQKGDVISIEYAITETKREEIFGITRYYENKNQ